MPAVTEQVWVPGRVERIWLPGGFSLGIWRDGCYQDRPCAGHYETRVIRPAHWETRVIRAECWETRIVTPVRYERRLVQAGYWR